MQKDTIKYSSISQRQKIPQGIRIRLENHFFLNQKPFKKKLRKNFSIFFEKFLMKVSGK